MLTRVQIQILEYVATTTSASECCTTHEYEERYAYVFYLEITLAAYKTTFIFIIYWVSKFIFSCFLLVMNVSRDSGEILLSPWQRS